MLIHRFETFPTEDNLKHLLTGLGNLGMDPATAWDSLVGGLPFRAAQVLSQQSTTSDGRKADQIDNNQAVIHGRTRPFPPYCEKCEPSVLPSRARLGFV